ncbi:kinase-like domain-containing protein [Cercophora newfieldiana]|uniref:Kinase-like domain-containing protein n=1 Tax=Cercophora newfieldiana TaxID=92897 RepID=A0AA40CSG5_9PEZI|nr:kinase-like domain-containing protein [Cercophora newfieldiana]
MPGGSVSPTIRSFDNREKSPNRYLGIQGNKDHITYTDNYATPQARLLSQFSVRVDGGLDLEGQHIARVALDIEPIDYSACSDEDLVDKIQEDLEPVLSSYFHKSKQYFLPWTVLHKVLSTPTVLRLLRNLNDKAKLTEAELDALAKRIAPPLHTLGGMSGQFRRTFAALILVERESMIFAFVHAELNDVSLLGVEFEGLKPKSKNFGSLFNGWRSKDIKRFESVRWELSPTFLAAKREIDPSQEAEAGSREGNNQPVYFKRILYELRSTEEVLPFQQVDRKDISGGFADVRFFKLHEDQQDLPRFTRDGSHNPIAVKTLKNESKGTADQCMAYVNEVYVMERLASTIPSPHIAKLLATIEVPKSVSGRERSDYHLVLEAADRNVESLWTSRGWWAQRGVSDLHLAKWVSRQCYGLTHALWQFHEFPKKDKDMNEKTRGLHCDIKPDNLLHYQNWDPSAGPDPKGTVDEKLGVIQLSDFGLSSFHSTRSVDNHLVAGDFLNYAAPETDFLLTHSPAAEVWHLGCLFMDFATWLLEGPDGYEKFVDERLTTGLRGERCRFATFTTGGSDGRKGNSPRTIVEVNQAVLRQATYLSEHEKSSDFVRELCHIAVNYMLVMRDTNQKQKCVEYSQEHLAAADRLTSRAAASILERMAARGDEYFMPSKVDVLPFDHPRWKRPTLELQYTVHQLQQISKRVRSGFKPSEAGLTKPGKIVTEK